MDTVEKSNNCNKCIVSKRWFQASAEKSTEVVSAVTEQWRCEIASE
jgi:hypothetical protein